MTKRSGVVPIDLASLDPKAQRKQLEAVSGARLRGWIMRAEVSFTECATRLGMNRPELYNLMEGVRGFKLAWLPLLPEAVQRVALEDLALGIGYELRPVAEAGSEADALTLVHEALDTIRAVTGATSDGQIDAREAQQILSELAEVDAAAARVRAHCRAVIERAAALRRMC